MKEVDMEWKCGASFLRDAVMLQEERSSTFALLWMVVWTFNVKKYQAYLTQKIHYFKKCFKFNIQIDSIILFFKIQNIWKIIQWKPFVFLGPPITEFLVQEAQVWLISFVIFPEIFYIFTSRFIYFLFSFT